MRPIVVLVSRIRVEEKLLLGELERRGIPVEVLDTRTAAFGMERLDGRYRGVLSREISHTRNLYASRLLEHAGLRVVNDSKVVALCGDKLLTTLALREARLPVPRCMVTLTPGAALEALDGFGYPAVVKPLTGSWGRLAARLGGRDAAEAVLEHREALPGPANQITYVQEYIDKPGRDIKAYVLGGEVVGAIYKVSSQWRTNTARGGHTQVCPLDDDLVKLLGATAEAIGDGVLGIDVIEDRDGNRFVNEVNHTPEFHGAIEVLGTGLVGRYVDHVLERLDER
ncbi:lysine biosynthesis protein LysX [Nonomuraea fuscirosea]|uniref:lysine biosynthesis protein LysX n=1 Tax=Nonomuraea fuscirosea TaxID=1291556 RepID=UPI0034399064